MSNDLWKQAFDSLGIESGASPERLAKWLKSADANRRGSRLGVIGTSLVQQNDVATSAKISHWNRGWLSWARYFSKGRFWCEIWHDPTIYTGWEPSQVAGSTRNFVGLNAGVSGQTAALIDNRKRFLVESVKCDLILIDSGTNDMAPLSKEVIQQYREDLAKYYLSRGITVVMMPILSRGTNSWGSNSAERDKAAWINQRTRAFCSASKNCYFFDWNSAWIDFSTADGTPKTGFSNDGIHFSPSGGIAVGEALANFLSKLLPDPYPRVWSPDDNYNATNNPLGNLLTNPFCTGTGGTPGTGASGNIAAGMRVEVSSGAATVACTKESRADGRGDWQVMTCSPGATDSLIYFRTNTADTTHTYPAGTWVQASVEADIGSFNGWQGVSLYMKDNGVGGLVAYDMEPFDDGAGNIKLPTRALSNGMLVTPPIQLVTGSASIRWRVEVRVGSTGGGASGTGVVKIGAIELRAVEDPRNIVAYRR